MLAVVEGKREALIDCMMVIGLYTYAYCAQTMLCRAHGPCLVTLVSLRPTINRGY